MKNFLNSKILLGFLLLAVIFIFLFNNYQVFDFSNKSEVRGVSMAAVSANIEVLTIFGTPRTSGLAPFTVLFNAENSGSNIVRYEWNFNDSNSDYPSTDEGRLVGHRFDNPGTYNVNLTIYDENGQSANSQITITALAPPAGAQTFYVSISGNSANDGLSPATSWDLNKILVKNTSFIPDGSKILFKRGDDFTTATSSFQINYLLRPDQNYITLDAYGTGEKPIFGPITTYAQDRYYNKGIIIQNLQIKTLKIQGLYGSSGAVYPGIQATLRNLKVENGDIHIWQSEGITLENIYVNRGCDTAANPADVTQCPTGMGLAVSADLPNGMGYTYVNNLEVNGAQSHCVYFAGAYHDILVENSNFHNCGVYLQTSLRDGFTAHGYIDNLTLRSNQIHHNNYALGLDSAYDNNTPPEYLRNAIIENNQIYSNQSPWPNTDHGIQIRSMQNSIFRNNLIYNNANNLFWIAGPKVDDGQLDEPTNNIEIYNNTIYTTKGSTILYLGHNVTPNHNDMVSNIYFKNNIVAGSAGKVLTSVLPDLSTVFMSNNIYSGVFVKPTIDPNSLNTDPLFVNSAGNNFQLQDSSPAINYGVSVNAKYDYAGVLRNSSPDAGAYENLSASPPPPPICQENWSCSAWSACAASNTQTRVCTDSNACGTVLNKPAENQSCVYMPSCEPTWSCTAWSACSSNNTQTRTCTDTKNCGTTSSKPAESQSCSVLPPTPPPTPTCTPTWSCSAWSTCNSSKIQTRTCTDSKNCNTLLNKPIESQSCGTTCSSRWSCAAWSPCHASGYKVRTCTDSNTCGSTSGIPDQSYSCSPPQSDVLYTTKYKYENHFQGRLVKLANDSAVYVVDSQNQRHLFVNAPTFWTWYSGGWAKQKLETISQSEFDNLKLGSNVRARAGVNLVKFTNSNKVYAVLPDNHLCEASALYGGDWQAKAITIQSGFENDYIKETGCQVTNKYPDGTLIQYLGSSMIWYIEDGLKHLVSANVFDLNKFKPEVVIKNVSANIVYETGWHLEKF